MTTGACNSGLCHYAYVCIVRLWCSAIARSCHSRLACIQCSLNICFRVKSFAGPYSQRRTTVRPYTTGPNHPATTPIRVSLCEIGLSSFSDLLNPVLLVGRTSKLLLSTTSEMAMGRFGGLAEESQSIPLSPPRQRGTPSDSDQQFSGRSPRACTRQYGHTNGTDESKRRFPFVCILPARKVTLNNSSPVA